MCVTHWWGEARRSCTPTYLLGVIHVCDPLVWGGQEAVLLIQGHHGLVPRKQEPVRGTEVQSGQYSQGSTGAVGE